MLQQLVDTTVLGSIYVLFALGMSLAWGILGILNLAHGAILMFAAYASSVYAASLDAPLVVALVIGALVGGVCSLILELGPFRVIRRSPGDEGELELRIVIASIGASTILVAIVAYYTMNASFSIATTFRASVYQLLGLRVSNLQIIVSLVGVGLSAALALWLKKSRNGRAVRAVASDPETASLMGISERMLASVTMFIAGAMAGLAGVFLVVYLGATEPAASSSLLTSAFAVIVIGGVGSIGGAVLGAMLLAFLETLVAHNSSGVWSPALAFGFIILFLLFRPEGLFTSSRTRVDRV